MIITHCIIIETFVWCLYHHIPPQASYRAFISGRLIALYKLLGVFPVVFRGNWWRIFAKCVLRVTGSEATNGCQDDQLCASLKAIIYGSIHGVQDIWDNKPATTYWIFLLVDAKTLFNEINQIGMLWTFRHLWPSGACFVFNCYCHWSSPVLRNGNRTASFMHSRVGVMQVAYGIGVLPLIKCLKAAYTNVTRPWYEDDADALGTFNNIGLYFNLLKKISQGSGYYPKPSKSVPIVHPDNLATGK